MYNSNFRIDYKNKKEASESKYAYAISEVRTVCCDFGCTLSASNLEMVREMERLEMLTIPFLDGTATVNITRL